MENKMQKKNMVSPDETCLFGKGEIEFANVANVTSVVNDTTRYCMEDDRAQIMSSSFSSKDVRLN